MGQELLVEQKDAGRDFVVEFDKSYPVDVAFWLLPEESDRWKLYVASDAIRDDNQKATYRKVLDLIGTTNPWLDPVQVSLLNSHVPLAQRAIQLRDQYAARFPTHYGAKVLAGMPVQGTYFYQPSEALAASS